MRINEKGAFADKVLVAASPYLESDPDFSALAKDVISKNESFTKAMARLSVVEISRLVDEDDSRRDTSVSTLRSYFQNCTSRRNPTWSAAGEVLVNAFKEIGWNMNDRANDEETKLIDTLLNTLTTQPKLKEAVTTIKAEEWIDELRQAQNSYKQHQQQRLEAKESAPKEKSLVAAHELGESIERMFRYINFQIEFKHSEPYNKLADSISSIIAEFRSVQKLRVTRAKNEKEKEQEKDKETAKDNEKQPDSKTSTTK